MGAAKKDPSVRARRNKGPGQATLGSAPRAHRPRLPQYVPGTDHQSWHPMVLLWWDAVWRSPMSQGFLHADARGLIRMAVLEHMFWTTEEPGVRLRVMSELRLQQQAYGLTPYDRRRLEWTIEIVDEVKERNARRRADAPKAAAAADPAEDPRQMLRLV